MYRSPALDLSSGMPRVGVKAVPIPIDQRLRILIAADHPLIRKQVRSILEHDYERFEVCGEAHDGAEAMVIHVFPFHDALRNVQGGSPAHFIHGQPSLAVSLRLRRGISCRFPVFHLLLKHLRRFPRPDLPGR
jgi:hypothetical protein